MTTGEQLTLDGLVEQASEAAYHTLLEAWLAVLRPAEEESKGRITSQWSSKILTTYPGLTYADMGDVHASFFEKVIIMRRILEDIVAEDEECLKRIDMEEDATLNRVHYVQAIISWQQQILQWELEWKWDDIHAAADIAATAEVHKMFFSDTGLLSLLDSIGFQFDDSDRDMLAQILDEQKAAFDGD